MLALLRLFMVRPLANATVQLEWNGQTCLTHTESDGFFRFEWNPDNPVTAGWHDAKVHLLAQSTQQQNILATGQGQVFIPHVHQYACISDIDDTFLISHSSNLRKRLLVLFTKNAHSRKPFEGVVKHYQLLAKAGATVDADNPFFYVSSSEWNLYYYIKDFSKKNELPDGIYLLSQIKRLKEVWKTGSNKHATKFMRIARIIESYPEQKFILLGDDSQEDPNIYSAIAEHFPGKIQCIYLRRVYKKKEEFVKKTIQKLEEGKIPCCYFAHSSEAVLHSKEIGLIATL
jgi:phosphatidate phosphatase APP1